MNENFEEKTLDVFTQSCDTHAFTLEYFKANVCNDVIKRLNEMIDYCVAIRSLGGDEKLTNRLYAVIDTLYCLGIIVDDELTDCRLRLDGIKK